MTSIVELIKNAKRSITIVCDLPAYGSFSDHKNFIEYKQALETQSLNGVAIRMIYLDSGEREAVLRKQFPEEKWSSWKQETTNKKRLEDFLNKYARGLNLKADDLHALDLLGLIEKLNLSTIDFFEFITNKTHTSKPIHVYCWIRDDEDTDLRSGLKSS